MPTDKPNPFASPVTSPAGNAGSGALATLGQRFAGALIDGLIVAAIGIPILMAVGFGLGLYQMGIVGTILNAVIGFVVGMGIFLGINGSSLAKSGQTVGKKLMKTQIVSDSGQLLPLPDLILKRYVPVQLASMIPFLGFVVGIVNAVLVFRPSRKCGHHEIAGTKVISLQ